MAFAGWIALTRGRQPALEFIAGYTIETSLSVDNLFVFLLLFQGFEINLQRQHKALAWGGWGAVVLRAFFIAAGVTLLEDATGEFFGTFLIPSIVHQDPHYRRMPKARIPRRVLHAVSRTVIAQHDDGRTMPNYATLLTYPIASVLSNYYVPGIHADTASTVDRVFTGYAFDPINNLITEFLPDIAKRIQIRIIFVQRILNQIAATPMAPAT